MVKVIFVLSLRFPARKENINMCIETVSLSNYSSQTKKKQQKKRNEKKEAAMGEDPRNPCCKK